MRLKITNQTSVRVRYSETDQMGYCYYGNYAAFFEVGRVETLRAAGMSYRELEESGVMLPVSTYNVKYKSPARYDDLLIIETTISEISGARITFEYTITCEDRIIATANTTLVFVSKDTMRPIAPPKAFIDIIKPYEIKE